MKSLLDLEKKINSELATKVKSTKINHNHICINIENENLMTFRAKRCVKIVLGILGYLRSFICLCMISKSVYKHLRPLEVEKIQTFYTRAK